MITRRSTGGSSGLASIITLVMLVVLAVMALLSFTTANATRAVAGRYAQATAQYYLVESAGQRLVAGIDDELAQEASDNFSKSDALEALDSALPQIAQDAVNTAESSDGVSVDVNAQMQDAGVVATVSSTDGHTLQITITVDDSLNYTISSWKISTLRQETSNTNLWTGGSNG